MPEISKTADQALSVLLELGDRGPMTPSALARSLAFNRTVTHRLLATLHQRGFVTMHDGGYSLGAALVRLAAHVQPELRLAAREILAGLAERIGETVVIHVAEGDDAVVLDEVVPMRNVLRVEHQAGSRHPLARGASGRALLAFLHGPRVERLIDTAASPDALRRQLASVRQLGYALSHDELQDGVHGLAVPVRRDGDGVVASLAVIVPTTRATGIADHLDDLLAAAEHISSGARGSGGREERA